VTATLVAEPRTAPVVAVPGLRERLVRPWPTGGWRGWAGPLGVTAIGGVLRFWNLGSPHAVVFDETYYVKDGLSLVRYGYERQAVDGADKILLAFHGSWRNVPIFKPDAEYVVHPPFGKWVIGASQVLFGPTDVGEAIRSFLRWHIFVPQQLLFDLPEIRSFLALGTEMSGQWMSYVFIRKALVRYDDEE